MSIDKAQKFKSIVDPEWEKTRKNFFGLYRVTPALPSAWLPSPGSSLYYYAYAVRPMAAFDGEMICNVFGRIEVANEFATPKIERLSEEIYEIGIQGMRPLEQKEIEIYRQVDRIEDYLKSLVGIPDERSEEAQLTRQFYRLWLDLSGVAQQIRLYHEEFFTWVEENQKTRWWKFW